ncbi:uncharacterized protein LOC130613866 [Hydractinia symbiolongicarpus]|uniref:uncharacterized protein LOC130613866 n=1 Tax=Hydractinia symbiolongicarpus TaxID=13093 RepID=UPI00254AD100|nr:uncharacterized protein LOC130613866 [Hydractinia symbiolongicarpus]
MKKLSTIALTEPQAAFAAFTHDMIISDMFLPSLLGNTISKRERALYKRSIKTGGLGIPILTESAAVDYESSKIITAPLVAAIIAQTDSLPNKDETKRVKACRVNAVREARKQDEMLIKMCLKLA